MALPLQPCAPHPFPSLQTRSPWKLSEIQFAWPTTHAQYGLFCYLNTQQALAAVVNGFTGRGNWGQGRGSTLVLASPCASPVTPQPPTAQGGPRIPQPSGLNPPLPTIGICLGTPENLQYPSRPCPVALPCLDFLPQVPSFFLVLTDHHLGLPTMVFTTCLCYHFPPDKPGNAFR